MVQYVSEFSFPKSPARPTVVAGTRPTIAGYAKGGHVRASTPQPFSRGGATTPFKYKNGGLAAGRGVSNDSGHTGGNGPDVMKPRAQGDGPVKYMKKGGLAKGAGVSNDAGHSGNNGPDAKGAATRGQGDGDLKRSKVAKASKTKGEKSSGVQKPAFARGGKVAAAKVKSTPDTNNPNDAVSPGSFKRTPPKQSKTNKQAANDNFDGEGRNTDPATPQAGNVERMTGYSDFKKGGSVHPKLKNLGTYAHAKKGGSVKEVAGGKAGSKSVKAPVSATNASEYESKAGTPGTAPGSRVEIESGEAHASMGGLSRGNSHAKNAAIHAKGNKAKAGALAGIAQALSQAPHQAPAPGIGAPPPGMVPGMGAPPGGAMGPRPMPPMAGGPMQAGMSHGGEVSTVIHHHVMHGGR